MTGGERGLMSGSGGRKWEKITNKIYWKRQAWYGVNPKHVDTAFKKADKEFNFNILKYSQYFAQ